MTPSPEQHKAALDAAVLAERERIAKAVDYEAEVCPCEEDAKVLRSTALLIRANFSYDDAERFEALSALPEQTPTRVESDLSSAREEIAELRKAAEPFAYMSAIVSNNLRHQLPDDAVIFSEEGDSQAWLTIGHFRRLVSALRSSRTKGE